MLDNTPMASVPHSLSINSHAPAPGSLLGNAMIMESNPQRSVVQQRQIQQQNQGMMLPQQARPQQQVVQVLNAQHIAQMQARQMISGGPSIGQQYLSTQSPNAQFMPLNGTQQQFVANANSGFALRPLVSTATVPAPLPRPLIRVPKLATVQTYAPYQHPTQPHNLLQPSQLQLIQQQQQQQQAIMIQQHQAQLLKQQQQSAAQATYAQQQQAVIAGLQARLAAANSGQQQQQYWVQNNAQPLFMQARQQQRQAPQQQQQQYILINGQPVLIQQQHLQQPVQQQHLQQSIQRSTVVKVPVMQQQPQHLQPANYAALVGRASNAGGGMLLDLSSLHAMQAMPGGGGGGNGSVAPATQIQPLQLQQQRRSFSGNETSVLQQQLRAINNNLAVNQPQNSVSGVNGSSLPPSFPLASGLQQLGGGSTAPPMFPLASGLQQLGGGSTAPPPFPLASGLQQLGGGIPSDSAGSSELRALLTCIGTELSRHGIGVTDAVQAGWLGSLAPDHAAIIAEAHAKEGARRSSSSSGSGSAAGGLQSALGTAGSGVFLAPSGGVDDDLDATAAALDPSQFSALNFGFFGDPAASNPEMELLQPLECEGQLGDILTSGLASKDDLLSLPVTSAAAAAAAVWLPPLISSDDIIFDVKPSAPSGPNELRSTLSDGSCRGSGPTSSNTTGTIGTSEGHQTKANFSLEGSLDSRFANLDLGIGFS